MELIISQEINLLSILNPFLSIKWYKSAVCIIISLLDQAKTIGKAKFEGGPSASVPYYEKKMGTNDSGMILNIKDLIKAPTQWPLPIFHHMLFLFSRK